MKHPLMTDGAYNPEHYPGLRNLMIGMRRIVVVPMMQEMTVAETISLYRWCNWWREWESIP